MPASTDGEEGPIGRPRGLIQRISLAADLVTLALAAIPIAALIVGFVLNQPQLGLIIGLGISVTLNLGLAVAFARKRTEVKFLSVKGDQLRSRVEEFEQGAKTRADAATTARASVPPPPSNRWIGDHSDPTTLKLTTAEFEKVYNGAVAIAIDRLGSDAEVGFSSLELMTWLGNNLQTDKPSLWFHGYSKTAEREALIICNGLDETPYVNSVKRGQKAPSGVAETPWRTDASWQRLIEASWVRMRPFKGSISVRYDEGWVIVYERTVDDEAEPEVEFRLDEGGKLAGG